MKAPNWELIQKENPKTLVDKHSLIGEGWGAWAYRINDEMVLKLPKRGDDGGAEMIKEFKVLDFVEPHLPIEVPRPIALQPVSAGWPHGYAIYSLVRGEELNFATLSVPQKSAAAKTLADFLRTLHALKPDTELQRVLPADDLLDEFNQTYERAIAQVLPAMLEEDASLLQRGMRTYLDNGSNFAYTPRLLHRDLHNEHLLSQDGSIMGILDFGDAIMSDPDTDFSDLYLEFGADFAKECARFYGHPDPDWLIKKLWHRSVFVFLYDLLYAPEFGMPDDVVWAQGALQSWVDEAKSRGL